MLWRGLRAKTFKIPLQCFEKFNNYFYDEWIVIHFLWDILRKWYSVYVKTLI